jgi:hypothetical protein
MDPDFHYDFDKKFHGAQLAKDLDISHLDPSHAKQLIALIKHYWIIFDERGTFTPVHGYHCVIDAGNAKLIAVKKIMYSPKETVQEHHPLGKSWLYLSDIWRPMVVQSPPCSQATSGAYFEHQGFCLEILCKLHSFKPSHMSKCLPNSSL